MPTMWLSLRVRPTFAGIREAVPFAVAIAAFGVSFGVVATEAGFQPSAVVVMSGLTFVGSAQFGAVSVLVEGGGAVAALVTSMLLLARYIPLGVSVAPSLAGGAVRRGAIAQLVIEESWAIGNVGGGRFDIARLIGAGTVIWVGWVGGTAVGAAGVGSLPPPEILGLDAVFPALFLALVWPHLRHKAGRIAGMAGVIVGVGVTSLAGTGIGVLSACALAPLFAIWQSTGSKDGE